MERTYKAPPVVWLRMTDYMHGWLQHELGGAARIQDQRVVCVQHLPGAREILRMETFEDVMDHAPVGNAMSATRKNCLCAGLSIDSTVIEREYGLTSEGLSLYIPIECPRMCLTKSGVLRPWTLDVCFGKEQSTAMQRLLRHEFWKAVEDFDKEYAREHGDRKYPAIDMIEGFCAKTETPDLYIDAIRREWQRRVKRTRTPDSC